VIQAIHQLDSPKAAQDKKTLPKIVSSERAAQQNILEFSGWASPDNAG
jgi:hypothetical protein